MAPASAVSTVITILRMFFQFAFFMCKNFWFINCCLHRGFIWHGARFFLSHAERAEFAETHALSLVCAIRHGAWRGALRERSNANLCALCVSA